MIYESDIFIAVLIILVVVFFFLLIKRPRMGLRQNFMLFVLTVVLGSAFLFIANTFGEDDLAWYSIFSFPIMYLYSLYFLISMIITMKNQSKKKR